MARLLGWNAALGVPAFSLIEEGTRHATFDASEIAHFRGSLSH